ncbi:TPA: type II toxin-antitoxin system RelE/ParE family toxin [Yersinia enterocolitica]|uniref:type II toxin-antitoxin system RelE/ParE family toxin n=1 Tax=Yersinia enterocolitica TaxID=630 RepID=UPI0029B5958B|nr:type II toxin-antitoxin system RelE/ParE family toxin [Yersinia enterocolitica]EKN5104316.1 type II toxin-antitoxin system RelE/ParE family toxin [Yersinia enterocolitica]EKN6091083.1 type II toxin-antitoxin system RelE/ParE family toxin [Yersinia enterocolitica]ELX2238840.1 type II toxin-antitoxin system RelE/ParE family toxin [Yersinia enterocolitica]ELY5242044.1 type II toxin-antitoxin system RelE/ParE family toxin [Yersinia enterocolitica]
MPRLIWTPEAVQDVDRLYKFLAEKNVEAARKAAKVILDETTKIEAFPEIGRPAEFINVYCRELLVPFGVSGYVVLYRYDGQLTTILAVKHQFEAGYLPEF